MNTSSSEGGFRSRVAEATERLSPRERDITDFMLNNPADAVTASAAELARMTGASDATVVRTARSLGYGGLRELKQALLEMITLRRDPALVLDQRLEQIENGGVLQHVVRDSAGLTGEVPAALDDGAWHTAVETLDTTGRVWCYGIGPAGLTAQHLALELVRIGKSATAVSSTGFRLADDLLDLDGGDTVVVFAPLRMFRETEVVLDHADGVGAPVVVVTEALAPLLRDRVRALLTTPPSTTGAASENLAGLLLAHALTLELAARDRSGSVTARQRLNQLRHDIAGDGIDTPVVEDRTSPPDHQG
ncbi:RpiR family transcriptional regulator [Haloactinospora alba]|uniref:RpiR family transcriptional regulator n=1 Tax=Haloactinospora alba TaxID=405555 RepID=A0A543NNL1_9ACTN|nr:MurR/RpiR family transcriptional regulator [Haloactinospora alba]TQN33366.1 RpiR family transcriptional regulator [Haloactinospora alba]